MLPDVYEFLGNWTYLAKDLAKDSKVIVNVQHFCFGFRCMDVGSSWETSPCDTCRCTSEKGSVDCVHENCASDSCENGYHLVYLEGQCCPVCGKNENCTCAHKTSHRVDCDGQLFKIL